MVGPKIANSKKPKKRWRIGGMRNKSKPKESAVDSDDPTDTATPESSNNSLDFDSNESQEDPHLNDLPSAMSEVDDDSDSDDDDLYLENSNDKQGIEKFSSFSKAPQPMNNNSKDEKCNTYPMGEETQDANQQGNTEGTDASSSDSSFEDDMERHRMTRRISPHFSRELAKISEDPDEPYSSNNPNTSDDAILDSSYEPNTNGQTLKTKQALPIVPSLAEEEKPAEEEEDEEGEKVDLPSHRELSKTLCKIVATEHYSGRESLMALEILSKWAHTQDSDLLKHLLTYGGVVKVVDFLDEQIDNVGLHAPSRMGFLFEAIHKAADVICNVCFVGKQGINEDIAVVNATVVVKYGGIESLLRATDVYNRSNAKDDPVALKAAEGIWNAIMNVYCNAEAAVTKEISMAVMDTSIELMSVIGSVDHPIATETLANVFNTLYRITYHGFVTKEDFQQRDLLNHCLSVFKRDVTTSEGDEELLEEAMSFLYGCHEKSLFNKGPDYESVLPLCVMGLREFALENENIREWASKLLDGACSNVENKALIMMAEGAIEVIAPFLTYEDVGPADKEFMRNLIRKIISPV